MFHAAGTMELWKQDFSIFLNIFQGFSCRRNRNRN